MKKILQILEYIILITIIVSFFLAKTVLIDNEYTLSNLLNNNFYYIFIIIIPILYAFTYYIKKEFKNLIKVVLVIFGLIMCLLIKGDMLYGWYIYIVCFILLGFISGIRLSKDRKNMLEENRIKTNKETEEFVKRVKNDKFKK